VPEVFKNEEFMEAGMKSWNTLTEMLEPESLINFKSIEEFEQFYSLIIERLFEEESSE